MNSTVSFNRRLSAAEKSKIIKYAKKSIHAKSNYNRVSRSIIRYRIKGKGRINTGYKKTLLHCIKVN